VRPAAGSAHGALLLASYSAGLAIPFLLIGLAFEPMTDALSVVKRHFRVIIAIGGAVMIVLGLLMLTGEFAILNSWVNRILGGWPSI
jgi:cytochrome c-type biogenesis protein